jgi:hypothetical protein
VSSGGSSVHVGGESLERRCIVDAGDDVDQHAAREPRVERARVGTRDPGDRLPQLEVLRAHLGLDLRIRTRGIRVELEPKQVAIGPQQRNVGVPHRLKDVVRVLAGGAGRLRGCFEAAGDPDEAVPDGGKEELLLRSKQLEQVWLGDARATGNRLRGRPGEAAGGELHGRRRDDLFSPFVGCQSWTHGKKLSTH